MVVYGVLRRPDIGSIDDKVACTHFFIRNLSTHMALKFLRFCPFFWPKRFLSSILFLVNMTNSRLTGAKLS